MEAIFQSKRVRFGAKDLLGQGGEASVYRVGAAALKIFSDPAVLPEKEAKIAAFPRAIPAEVLGPLGPVTAPDQTFLGYGMPLVEGASDIRVLSDRRARLGKIGQSETAQILVRVGQVLSAIHGAGLVVGDLNDGNVLLKDGAPRFIDADSYQFGPHRSTVAHERFLDPRLYGLDLARSAAFSTATDWYAFDVLVFASLLFVHPYGGVLAGAPTLLRRAEARASILRPGVKLPPSALAPEILSEELLQRFLDTFERDRRGPFPLDLLDRPFSRCSCGLEHQRRACPGCKVQVGVPERKSGTVTAVRVFRTDGVIETAAFHGGLKVLHRDAGGRVLREDGTELPLPEQALAVLAGDSTYLSTALQTQHIRRGALIAKAPRSLCYGRPMIAAGARAAFRLEDDWLVDAVTGSRIGSILENATTILAGEDRGLGFYRVGAQTHFFAFGGPAGVGLRPIALPSISGRLLAARAYFDPHTSLLALECLESGKRRTRLHLLDARGLPIAHAEGSSSDEPFLASAGGFALFSGRILRATDRGLLAIDVDRAGQKLTAGRLFTETEPFVSSDSELLAGPGGSVFVVDLQEIVELRLS
ncbi:MAG: hypothetical protein U1E65_08730 [Myxococcota bacterium]